MSVFQVNSKGGSALKAFACLISATNCMNIKCGPLWCELNDERKQQAPLTLSPPLLYHYYYPQKYIWALSETDQVPLIAIEQMSSMHYVYKFV